MPYEGDENKAQETSSTSLGPWVRQLAAQALKVCSFCFFTKRLFLLLSFVGPSFHLPGGSLTNRTSVEVRFKD